MQAVQRAEEVLGRGGRPSTNATTSCGASGQITGKVGREDLTKDNEQLGAHRLEGHSTQTRTSVTGAEHGFLFGKQRLNLRCARTPSQFGVVFEFNGAQLALLVWQRGIE
jgi:hypothetical protein